LIAPTSNKAFEFLQECPLVWEGHLPGQHHRRLVFWSFVASDIPEFFDFLLLCQVLQWHLYDSLHEKKICILKKSDIIVSRHRSVSLNNENFFVKLAKINCSLWENCGSTAREGSDLNSACLNVLDPVKYFSSKTCIMKVNDIRTRQTA
jgi:hypothetical protein